jgi:hypothetical protein
MDKGLVKEIIAQNPTVRYQVIERTANASLEYIGTISELDVGSYKDSLMLATDQGTRKISYQSILEINPFSS